MTGVGDSRCVVCGGAGAAVADTEGIARGGEGQGAVSKGVIAVGAVVNARGRGHNRVLDE
jgi:hypothetical protein